MSKVIFLNSPTFGHVNPTLALVKELVSRGELVIYYNSEKFRRKIESTGASFRLNRYLKDVYDDDRIRIIKGNQRTLHRLEDITGLIYAYLDYFQQVYRGIIGEIKHEKPDYVIYDSGLYWGKMVAKQLEIPAVSSISTFAFCNKILDLDPAFFIRDILWLADEYLMDKQATIQKIKELSQTLAALFHLENFNLMDAILCPGELNIVYTSRYFQYYSQCFDERFKFVGPSLCLDRDEEQFSIDILKDKPLIYISLGSVYVPSSLDFYVDFYKACFQAFGNSDKQVILKIGTTDRTALGKIPGNFIVEPYISPLEILPYADLFITHGGMNSVNEGLFFNVPLIICPIRADQFIVARRVEELGAGIYIKDKKITAELLKEKTEKISSNETFARNSRKISDSLRSASGAQRAVDEIFSLKKKYGID